MKKLLCITLCLLLLGCSAPAEVPETPDTVDTPAYDYLVGFGRRDITPKESVPMSGYGYTSNRMSETVLDELYATAVAVTDQRGRTMILFSMDLINANNVVVTGIKERIYKELGISASHVMVTQTHTHSGPDQSNTSATEYIKQYREEVIDAAVKAAVAAYNDRKEATMYTSAAMTEGLNFVRHYEREDGTYTGPGFGSGNSPLIGHAGEPDREVRLIRFERKDGKDILMMNWQAHAVMNSHSVSYKKDISADIVCGIRAYLETNLDCNFIYFQGAAGDLMPTSQITGETPTKNVYEYGKMLGDEAIRAMETETKREAGPIRLYSFTFDVRVNHEDDVLFPAAIQVKKHADENNGSGSGTLAHRLGLISRHHASRIITCTALGDTLTRQYGVFSIGDVGFANAPHELFSDTGIAIRENSPFDMTFILGYTNESHGYVPTVRAYEYSAYEVACSSYAKGTAEELATVFAAQWEKMG